MIKYGTRKLKKGCKGEDVVELQIRLSGFSGGVPDGDFGPGTERSVKQFQKDFMKVEETGIVDRSVYVSLINMGWNYTTNWDALECPCGTDPQFNGEYSGNWDTCGGFGKGQFKDVYRDNKPKIEAYHKYEYPGIHRSILWAFLAVQHYFPEYDFTINCGYRCWTRNKQKGRFSTNHMGKAIDVDVPRTEDEGYTADRKRCNEIREKLVDVSCAQIGWAEGNKKSLEPESIAPTWIHYDVRNFNKKYLTEDFFCTDDTSLFNGFKYEDDIELAENVVDVVDDDDVNDDLTEYHESEANGVYELIEENPQFDEPEPPPQNRFTVDDRFPDEKKFNVIEWFKSLFGK